MASIGNDFNWIIKHFSLLGQDDRTEEETYFVQTIEFGDRSIHSVISLSFFTEEMK